MSSTPPEHVENGVDVPSSASKSADSGNTRGSNENAAGLDTAQAVPAADNTTSPPPTVSKSQLKRQRRWEQAMEKKKRRKQQEKEIKIAKALAQGRDLEEERRLMEERTKSGVGHQRREAEWLERMKSAETSFRVR